MNFMYGKEIGELLLLKTINDIYVQFADVVDLAFKNDLDYAATESLLSITTKTDVQ